MGNLSVPKKNEIQGSWKQLNKSPFDMEETVILFREKRNAQKLRTRPIFCSLFSLRVELMQRSKELFLVLIDNFN